MLGLVSRDASSKLVILTILIFFFAMKYFYEKSNMVTPCYGRIVTVNGDIWRHYTLYEEHGVGVGVIQQKFDPETLSCWWDCLDPVLANDIYLNKNFAEWFLKNASADIPIFKVRSVMWALRMKPLKKESWEKYFT